MGVATRYLNGVGSAGQRDGQVVSSGIYRIPIDMDQYLSIMIGQLPRVRELHWMYVISPRSRCIDAALHAYLHAYNGPQIIIPRADLFKSHPTTLARYLSGVGLLSAVPPTDPELLAIPQSIYLHVTSFVGIRATMMTKMRDVDWPTLLSAI